VRANISAVPPPAAPLELEDIRIWLPPVLDKTADRIEISSLLIPTAKSRTLQRTLRWVIDQLSPGNDRAEALVAEAETQVLHKNWSYYEALRRGLQGVELKNPAKKPHLDGLHSLCALQMARLIEYGK
jgi:hypothetical protein